MSDRVRPNLTHAQAARLSDLAEQTARTIEAMGDPKEAAIYARAAAAIDEAFEWQASRRAWVRARREAVRLSQGDKQHRRVVTGPDGEPRIEIVEGVTTVTRTVETKEGLL